MPAIVVDASLACAWCFPDEQTDYTDGVLRGVSGPLDGIAPRLWAYEIRNSISTGLRRGRISRSHAERFLASLNNLRIRLVDPTSYDHIFELAQQYSLTVYDAAYLDLALQESLPLASLDNQLRRAALQAGVSLFEP